MMALAGGSYAATLELAFLTRCSFEATGTPSRKQIPLAFSLAGKSLVRLAEMINDTERNRQ
jgi:hypothetical protein